MAEMLVLRKHFLLHKSYFVYCFCLNLIGVCFCTFLRSVQHFHRCCIFFTYSWTGSTRVWRTSTPTAHVVAFISRKFFSCFRKAFLKLKPTSAFTVKGLLSDEELAKSIACLLNCKPSVILVTDIARFTVLPSSSLSFASGSLKPEINFIFTNSFLGLAAVLCFSKSH